MKADEIISSKWDQCVARLIVNSGIGLAAGIGLSAILFRRRFWPIPLAVGFAAGMSYQECKQSFAPNAIPLPGHWKKEEKQVVQQKQQQ